MPRNFNRRIEIAFPVLESQLQAELQQILTLQLKDSTKAWRMEPDGSYVRNQPQNGAAFRFQERFYEMLSGEEFSRSSKVFATVNGQDFLGTDHECNSIHEEKSPLK